MSSINEVGNSTQHTKLFFFTPTSKKLIMRNYNGIGKHAGRFVHAAVRGGPCAFTLKVVNKLIKTQLTRREAFDLDIESTHGQPCSCRARPVNVDDGLENIRWIRGLGGEKLPAASYALLPKRAYFLPPERDREHFVAGFLHKSALMCFYQTFGRRPPPFTGRFVNTVTSGWVGASNERAPFRFHGAVVDFVDRCLSNTRNLAPSNKHVASFFLRPIMAQDRFSVFLKSLKLFYRRSVLIASGTELVPRVSLKL